MLYPVHLAISSHRGAERIVAVDSYDSTLDPRHGEALTPHRGWIRQSLGTRPNKSDRTSSSDLLRDRHTMYEAENARTEQPRESCRHDEQNGAYGTAPFHCPPTSLFGSDGEMSDSDKTSGDDLRTVRT